MDKRSWMSSVVRCVGIAAIGAVMAVCWTAPHSWAQEAQEASDNLLNNDGFEKHRKDEPGLPLGWAFEGDVGLVTGEPGQEVHSGKHALRLQAKTGGWSARVYQGLPDPIVGVRDYELIFWAKGGEALRDDKGGLVKPRVLVKTYHYAEYRTEWLGGSVEMKAAPGNEWRQFKASFTVAEETKGKKVFTFALALHTQGNVIIDDVVLRKAQSWKDARIFYLPFDGSFDAPHSAGSAKAELRGKVRLVKGYGGQAASFMKNAHLVYDAKDNFIPSEGTLAMWVKPYWDEADGRAHCFVDIPVPPEMFTDGGFVMTKGFTDSHMVNTSYFYNSPGHYNVILDIDFSPGEWIHLTFGWSNCCASIAYAVDLRVREIDYATLRSEMAANYPGDCYPLTSYSLEDSVWMAWQFNRPELGRGMV